MAKLAISAVDNGKALEYCFAQTYYNFLLAAGVNVQIQIDGPYNNTLASFGRLDAVTQVQFMSAAQSTINSMIRIEPALLNDRSANDNLVISIASDAAGQAGDVRDVIFTRNGWQIGFSVKNNHDAAKHSRMSPSIDFGQSWLGYPCSALYFNEINVVFGQIQAIIAANRMTPWSTAFANKYSAVYIPLLTAFKNELLRLYALHADIPEKLLSYLIGRNSFYKIIKEDRYNLVVVKGYNMNRDLGKKYNSISAVCGIPRIVYPTRIIEIIQLPGDLTSLYMTLDHGWQIKFRIHSASKRIQNSLKFDITLIGNPPILFTHHIF